MALTPVLRGVRVLLRRALDDEPDGYRPAAEVACFQGVTWQGVSGLQVSSLFESVVAILYFVVIRGTLYAHDACTPPVGGHVETRKP